MIEIIISDICFTCGILCFMWSALTQWWKVYKTHETAGISLKHYKIKMIAVGFMTTGYVVDRLLLSLTTSIIEGFITVTLIIMIISFRKDGITDEKS